MPDSLHQSVRGKESGMDARIYPSVLHVPHRNTPLVARQLDPSTILSHPSRCQSKEKRTQRPRGTHATVRVPLPGYDA